VMTVLVAVALWAIGLVLSWIWPAASIKVEAAEPA
jgi:hypothetical protein